MAGISVSAAPSNGPLQIDEGAFDASRAWRTRLGFVLISNDTLTESDVSRMAPDGVEVHFTRSRMPTGCTIDNLASMLDGLAEAAAELLPEFEIPVVGFACTSGSAVMGEAAILKELNKARPDRIGTTLLSGVIAGLNKFGAKKIVMGTPYTDDVTALETRYLEQQGFEFLNVKNLGLTYDSDMTRVKPSFIRDFALSIDHPDAEAIFISCNALRTIDVIEEIEQTVGKPVLASNQGMMWQCLRLAGIDDKIDGYGRLLREF